MYFLCLFIMCSTIFFCKSIYCSAFLGIQITFYKNVFLVYRNWGMVWIEQGASKEIKIYRTPRTSKNNGTTSFFVQHLNVEVLLLWTKIIIFMGKSESFLMFYCFSIIIFRCCIMSVETVFFKYSRVRQTLLIFLWV